MATEYVVLRLEVRRDADGEEIGDSTTWRQIGRATAATSQAAIKAATDGKPAAERTGTFVATPVRSWRPVPRKVAMVEKDTWG